MIVNVNYKSSNGQTFDFQIDKLRIKSANYHEWAYTPDVLGRRFGDWVLRFNKEAASYTTKLFLWGSHQFRQEKLTAMHTAFEHDIRQNTPGRLTWGECYIDCFILGSSTYPDDDLHYTVNDIEIYAPYPFWIQPKKYEFYSESAASEYAVVGSAIVGVSIVGPDDAPAQNNFLDYAFGYDYDYTTPGVGTQLIENDSPGAAPFEMIIFGPAVNPFFYVGDQQYIVRTNVQDGEYLTINSKNKTVYRTTNTGEKINEFNNRGKVTSIFDPIPEGTQKITWPATFGMTLTLLEERSEPV